MTRLVHLFAPLVVVATLAACASDEQRAYEQVARTLNPLIIGLGPVIGVVGSARPADPGSQRQVIAACDGAMDIMRELRDASFPRRALKDDQTWELTHEAEFMTDYWDRDCRQPRSAFRLARCAADCIDTATSIARVIGVLHTRSHAEGVEILALPAIATAADAGR